jgi:hypothetical protein
MPLDVRHQLPARGDRAAVIDEQPVIAGRAPANGDSGPTRQHGEKIDFVAQANSLIASV